MNSIWIGFDPREAAAFAVARHSLNRHLSRSIPVHGLVLSELQARGLYTRPIELKPSAADRPVMWDVLSDAPMSTQHANARFLVPHLARAGWALFMDGDMLVRCDLAPLFDGLDPRKAVYCVQHRYDPPDSAKMDGQVQTRYARKNWSSFIAFNCDHPANKSLTLDDINTRPGRDLHALYWLTSWDIGELDPAWNWLARHSSECIDPKVVHFTAGTPDMLGYENDPFADEWRDELKMWAAA